MPNSTLRPFVRLPFSVAILFAISTTLGFSAESHAQRPPVTWVNPKLPKGEGLAHHVLNSKAMGHEVGYVVWTPAGFDASGKTKYPVIYFLHGMGGNESGDSAGFSGLIRRGIRDGVVPPAICVFPNGGRSGYRGKVETMIVDELIPQIDQDYPTKAEAKGRAVAGFSMGGAGSVRLSMSHPDLFCVAGSWGGGMWRGAEAILESAEKGADTLKANDFSILLVNGDKDRPEAFEPLKKKLDELGVANEVVVLKDTRHNLGLYYQRAGKMMAEFLGKGLGE